MHCISLFTASRASKLLNKRFGGRGDLSKNGNVLPEATLFFGTFESKFNQPYAYNKQTRVNLQNFIPGFYRGCIG